LAYLQTETVAETPVKNASAVLPRPELLQGGNLSTVANRIALKDVPVSLPDPVKNALAVITEASIKAEPSEKGYRRVSLTIEYTNERGNLTKQFLNWNVKDSWLDPEYKPEGKESFPYKNGFQDITRSLFQALNAEYIDFEQETFSNMVGQQVLVSFGFKPDSFSTRGYSPAFIKFSAVR
jgi:hypothetical protein